MGTFSFLLPSFVLQWGLFSLIHDLDYLSYFLMNLSCSDFSVFCVSLEMVGFYAFLDLVSCSYPTVEKETEFFA